MEVGFATNAFFIDSVRIYIALSAVTLLRFYRVFSAFPKIDGFDTEYARLCMVRLTHIFVLQRNLEAIAFGSETSSIQEDNNGMILITLGFLFTINLYPSSWQLVSHIYQSVSDIAAGKITLRSHVLQLVEYSG